MVQDEWERDGAVELEDANVERYGWDNQPDGYRLRVGFKRKITTDEAEESVFKDAGDVTIEREEYRLGSLLRDRGDMGDVYLRSRNDVTNDVVEAALERALWVYCTGRFDPEDVCVHNVHVEEHRKIRSASGGNENGMGVSQPHSSGAMPEWADE